MREPEHQPWWTMPPGTREHQDGIWRALRELPQQGQSMNNEPMRAPSPLHRTEAMVASPASSSTFTVTAAHLARMMENVRLRERAKLATLLRAQATVVMNGDEASDVETFIATYLPAAEVRTLRGAPVVTHPAEVDPLLQDIDTEVAKQEAGGDGLPPVRHHDDFEEGTAIARSHGFRGGSLSD